MICDMRSARTPILSNPDRLQKYPNRTAKKTSEPALPPTLGGVPPGGMA